MKVKEDKDGNPPTFNDILEARRRFKGVLLREYSMSPGWRQRVTREVSRIITGSPTKLPTSLIQEYLQEPVYDFMDCIASELAADMHRIYKRELPRPWNGDMLDLTFRCNDIVPFLSRKDQYLYKILLEVLGRAGSSKSAPESSEGGNIYTVPRVPAAVSITAKKATGIRNRDFMPTRDDLGGMIFSAGVARNPDGTLRIEDINPRSCEAKYNSNLVSQRAEGCIKEPEEKCEYCWRGWDTCSLAYHRQGMEKGICIHPSCRSHGYITSSGLCLRCRNKGRMPPRKYKEK